MESYLAIVLTNKDKSIDDVMKPFGIKQKIAKYIGTLHFNGSGNLAPITVIQ